MELPIHLNFYAVGMLIATGFTTLAAVMMFRVPERPVTAVHLGLAFAFMSLHNLAYVVGVSLYHPLAAYHRFGIAAMAIPSLIHMAQFFLHLPHNQAPRHARLILVVMWAVHIAATVRFIVALWGRESVYDFDSMLYDFPARDLGLERALLVIAFALATLAAGVWRTLVAEGRERRAVAAMLAAFLVTAIAPIVANTMARAGQLSQGVFQNVFSLVTILGFFFIVVVFINTTRDRTTFMTKIVGVSVATILTLLQYTAYYALLDREESYDRLRMRDASRMAVDASYRPEAIRYFVRHDPAGPVALLGDAGSDLHRQGVPDRIRKSMQSGGARLARVIQSKGEGADRVTAYAVPGPGGKLYEAGFAHVDLRKYLHRPAERLVWILFVVMLIASIGFRLFFLGALVNPLERLIEGVRRVDAGGLDVHVPVHVDDEIGYLTRSFNGMVDSIRSAQQRLQEHADLLEARVAERTRELQETLGRVEALKAQQDGDYFLTSLLLKPLATSRGAGSFIRSSSFLRQKKRFTFRHWEEDIGGDICISDSIQLRNRDYIVFLNADAMGKSIQGAGGALVLGSVFRAILERTRLNSQVSAQLPERWLKNAMIELGKVFETFQGSMLVSAVFGLIDEAGGLVLFVNADHPRSVLLRGGQASFLEEVPQTPKLGVELQEEDLVIRAFQMRPGDTLIVGSDGRDDWVCREESRRGAMNDDESQFLRVVEVAGGRLESVYERLLELGDPIDDVSLLAFYYDGPPAPVADPSSEVAEVSEIKSALRAGRLQEAAERAAIARERHPCQEYFLHLGALAHKGLRNLNEALDLAEAALLRSPLRLSYLLNLADLHRRAGNRERAELLRARMEKHFPGDSRVERFSRMVAR